MADMTEPFVGEALHDAPPGAHSFGADGGFAAISRSHALDICFSPRSANTSLLSHERRSRITARTLTGIGCSLIGGGALATISA